LTGSLVGIAKAQADATIVPGKWNAYDVTANGDHCLVAGWSRISGRLSPENRSRISR